MSSAVCRFEISVSATNWIGHMLASYTATITEDEINAGSTVTLDRRQGGVLSPSLWNLVVYELLETIESQFLDTLMEITQKILRIVEACLLEHDYR